MNRSSSTWLTLITCTRKEASLCSRQEYTLKLRLCSRCLERRSWGQLQRSSAKRAFRFFQQLFETMALLLIHAVPSSYVIPQHKLWVEQPENFPTCLATKPCPKEVECLVGTLKHLSWLPGSAEILQKVQTLQGSRVWERTYCWWSRMNIIVI